MATVACIGSIPGFATAPAGSQKSEALPADTDHVLRRWSRAERVPFALAGDRPGDGAHEVVVARPRAQQVAQRQCVVMPQAGVQLAGRREAQAVAIIAEMLGHRRDDAEAEG